MQSLLKYTITSLFLFAGVNLNAQNKPDTAVLSYDVNIMDYTDCSCDTTPMQISASNITLQLKQSEGRRLQLVHKFSYTHHDKGFKGYFDLGAEDQLVLHGLMYSYRLDMAYALTGKWTLHGNFKPQYRSYLDENNREFYTDYEGGMMIEFAAGGNWTFGGGYAYTRNLSEGLVHPVILAEYDNKRTFRAKLFFPETAEVWFKPSQRFGIGAVATLDGDEFRGSESTYGQENVSIQYADFTVGPAVNYKATKSISLNLKAAYTAGRHFVIEGDDFRDKLNPSPTIGVHAGLKVSL